MWGFFCVVMPRPGVRTWRGGENLLGPEEPASQATTGPADQQQSQAVGPLLLYPLAPCKHHCGFFQAVSLVHQFCLSDVVLCLQYCDLDPSCPQTLSKPACLCCGATWSTTCCIIPPLIPKTLSCLGIVYTALALQMVKK